MEVVDPEVLHFSKKSFSWCRTIYVLGLPRSGKSTILSLITSCVDVEGVDEPYELHVLAQKGGSFQKGSDRFDEYMDSYSACMENYFSELALGRRYNFRRLDKSFILNTKSKESVRRSISRRRRSDVIEFAAKSEGVFVLAFNEMERSVAFITHGMPAPCVVYVRRSLEAVAQEIAEKGWLSDNQLRSQANMTPAFKTVVHRNGIPLYIPYQIPNDRIGDFLEQSDFERALLCVSSQDAELRKRLDMLDVPVANVDFDRFVETPALSFSQILEFAKLRPTDKTASLLSAISATN